MSKSRTILALLVVLTVPAASLAAPAPYVANHLVTDAVWVGPTTTFDYMDLPGSEQTLTLPAGTVLISWSCAMFPSNQGVYIRPKIGDDFPVEGTAVLGGRSNGSWLTTTTGGSITVGLQVKNLVQPTTVGQVTPWDSMSWSIIVPTETGDPVPAIGDVGLGIMIVTFLAAGGWVLSRRRGMPA